MYLNSSNATLLSNVTKYKKDVVAKIRLKFSTSEENIRFKSDDILVIAIKIKGKDVYKIEEEKLKQNGNMDPDLVNIDEIILEPVGSVSEGGLGVGEPANFTEGNESVSVIENETTSLINIDNSNLEEIPSDENYYDVLIYLDVSDEEFKKNKTKYKKDAILKLKEKYGDVQENIVFKNEDIGVLSLRVKGNDINDIQEKTDKERWQNSFSIFSDNDLDSINVETIIREPVFGVNANPEKGDNKNEVKGDKANSEIPNQSSTNLTGKGYSITVIDTGVNYSAPDFGGHGEGLLLLVMIIVLKRGILVLEQMPTL